MERIDRLLVDQGVVISRTQAQRLIAEKRVKVWYSGKWERPGKPSQKYPSGVEVQVEFNASDRFVSRGGLKLAGAMDIAGLDISGFKVLDVGQSTGGFTDCVLQAGADKVVGVEVGHDQLVPSLRENRRVVCLEGINARDLPHDLLLEHIDGNGFDLAVMDVSFISQTKILPSLVPVLREGGHLLSLVKPQFEVGPSGLGKGGIVRNEKLYPKVQKDISALCESLGLEVKAWFDSPIKGGDGNREFFVWAVKA